MWRNFVLLVLFYCLLLLFFGEGGHKYWQLEGPHVPVGHSTFYFNPPGSADQSFRLGGV